MTNYLVVDGNSLGHFAQNGRPLSIGDLPVQAIYNFLRNLRGQCGLYSNYFPIVTWDGASWRNMTYPDYKLNREKMETKNEVLVAEQKASYKRQLPYIKKALRFLGVCQVSALNMEADDLAASIVTKFAGHGKIVLLSGDKDWLQLVGPGVVWKDFIRNRTITEKNFEEFTGVATPRQFVEVKALSGDAGDNVPGVGGIGSKGAIDFIKTYGSFSNFLNMCILEKSVDPAGLPKKLRDLIEDEAKAIAFERNLKLMDLRTSYRPEMLNYQMDRGAADIEQFRKFCDLLLFKSITQDLEEWIRVFPSFRHIVPA